jgi:NTP pyrophosphatase (non-canonical NTP hydrolase)
MVSMTIQELIQQSHATALEKGWWDKEINFGEKLMLMVTELAEVMEEYRKYGLDEHALIYNIEEKPEGIAIEFADLLIRVADACGKYNIPLEEALKIKLEYNTTRSYRHGDKLA